ncbi:hypothetical protein DAEQUDRAFT_726489 [Daedalea quercina L-15889]|uniref:DUF6533 domain-containing protein n=1 Tax=Daedalea quercina L-15889 TaxID=1314783 RepID=A0A165QIS3_9APHY|nr:hypothetical protein DAEQUDRAFT_726489 [Daedalea quercina L-15889]
MLVNLIAVPCPECQGYITSVLGATYEYLRPSTPSTWAPASSGSPPHGLMQLFDPASIIVARNITAVALSLTLWDHVLTFGREIQLLWRLRWSPLQVLLLLNRYGAIASMIFITKNVASFSHMSWVTVTNEVCQAMIILITVYCIVNSASSQFALLIHVHKLFDERSAYRSALAVGFIACFSASITFGALSIKQTFAAIQNHVPGSLCVNLLRRDFEIGMWGAMVLYNVYVFLLLAINAMHRPRRSDSEIVARLLQEGAFVFLTCSALRLSQLVSSVLTVGVQSILVPLVAWSIDGILTYRLLLKVKAVEMVTEGRIAQLVNLAEAPSIQVYHEVYMQER